VVVLPPSTATAAEILATEILAAADRRDTLAEERDLAAERREEDLDLAEFLAQDGDYGHDWPQRRATALDRARAKEDRLAARRDRDALAHDLLTVVSPEPR
jgi:hypothetical protein